jgi:hypothetical protein
MRITLSEFARAGIEDRVGPDVEAGVESALERYARRVADGPKPPEFPRFRGSPSPEQLAVHAVLVYLAELDRACVEVIRAPARS